MGGLGNQMFQYAFGLYTANKNKTKLKIDIEFLRTSKKNVPDKTTRHYEFYELSEVFNIPTSFTTSFESELYNGKENSSIVRKAFFKIIRLFFRPRLFIQNGHEFNNAQLNLKNNTCIVGRFQSERYFKPIENEIRKQFTFKNQVSPIYNFYLKNIQKTPDTVSVHIRRTDYTNHPIYSKILGPLPDRYYEKAVKKINELLNNPPLFIFSDDINTAKSIFKQLDIPNKIEFVSVKEPNPHDELQLISLCQHHIISNSTFSWWGAWLSSNKNKIVIAPAKWSKDPKASSKYIIPENYIKISC